MRAFDHKDVTAAMLVAASVAEPDLACVHPWWGTSPGEREWVPGTQYTGQDNYVIRTATHRVYRSLQSSIGLIPEKNPLHWEDFGPTNRWAPFDMLSSTALVGASPLTITLDPGVVSGLDVSGMENVATARLQVWDEPSGDLTFDETQSSLWWGGDLWLSYFFDLPYQRRRVRFSDLPASSTARMTLTLASFDGSPISVSQVAVGRYVDFGLAEYGMQMRIRHFGQFKEDPWGNTKITRGIVTRDLSGNGVVEAMDANRVAEFAAKNAGRSMIWEVDSDPRYDYLSTTGIADVAVAPETAGKARLSLDIHGVAA